MRSPDTGATRTAGCGVAVVALTAAVISFEHVRALALEAGERELPSWLLPVSIDGAIAAAVAVLLADSRAGRRPAALTWMLLGLGLASSLAANVASAQPTATARAVAAWPPIALALGIEVLAGLIRRSAGEFDSKTVAETSTPSGSVRGRQVPSAVVARPVGRGSFMPPATTAELPAGRPAGRQIEMDDHAAIALIRELDLASENDQASRFDIQKTLGCGGSRAARLARLARQPSAATAQR